MAPGIGLGLGVFLATTTALSTPPLPPLAIVAVTPTDDSVNVSPTAPITVTFNRAIAFGDIGGANTVVLRYKPTSFFGNREVFSAATETGNAGGSMSIAGATLTITPGSPMTGVEHALGVIGAAAIKDLSGNYFAGYSSDTQHSWTVDATAPTLSSPTDAANGGTASIGSVSTDEGNGTLYWVVTTSATAPSAAQVKAGQDNGGSAAAASGSQAISTTGVKNIAPTGLTSETAYTTHYMHEDAAGNQSDVASASGFTTADVTAPTLTSPTDAANGATASTGSVSTNEANGTLYWVVTESATAPSAPQVKSGADHTGAAAQADGSQAIVGTGAQTLSPAPSGLVAETSYTTHFMQEDDAGNQSVVVSASGFTTSAASSSITVNRGYQSGVDYGTTGTIFVSLSGNDTTGDGSVGNPYRTIGKALSVMSPGDVIKVRGGTYRGERRYDAPVSGIDADNRCRLEPYGTETVIISGAVVIPLTFTACANAAEAGGNPNFANIVRADVPASLTHLTPIAWNLNQGGTGALYLALYSANTSAANDFTDYFFHNDPNRGFDTGTILVPRIVTFDGSTSYMTRGGALTGAVDGDQITIAARLATNSDGAARTIFQSANGRISLSLNASDQVVVTVQDTAGGTIVSHTCTAGTVKTADGVVTIALSLDSTTGAIHVYKDDVDITGTSPSVTTGNDIDLTDTDFAFGGTTAGSSLLDADVEYLWLDATYIDLSSSANRFDFRNHQIGEEGTVPTGGAPLVFLSANRESCYTNKLTEDRWGDGVNAGTGGDWTANGTGTFGTPPAPGEPGTAPYQANRDHATVIYDPTNAVGWSADERAAIEATGWAQFIWNSNRIAPCAIRSVATDGTILCDSPPEYVEGGGGLWSILGALPALDKAGLWAVNREADGSGNHTVWIWPTDAGTLDNFEVGYTDWFLDQNGKSYWTVQGFDVRHFSTQQPFDEGFFVGNGTGGHNDNEDYWTIENNIFRWFGAGEEKTNYVGTGPISLRAARYNVVRQNTLYSLQRHVGMGFNSCYRCINDQNLITRPGSTGRYLGEASEMLFSRDSVSEINGGHAAITVNYQNSNDNLYVGEFHPPQNGQFRYQQSDNIALLSCVVGASDLNWAFVNESAATGGGASPQPIRLLNLSLVPARVDPDAPALFFLKAANSTGYIKNGYIHIDGSDYSDAAVRARLLYHDYTVYGKLGIDQVPAYWTQGADELVIAAALCMVDPDNGDYTAIAGGPLDGTGEDISTDIDALKTQFAWADALIPGITDTFDYDERGALMGEGGVWHRGARSSPSSAPSTVATLSSATAAKGGYDGATGGLTISGNALTVYSVWTTSATTPTAAQIIAGQDHTGAAAQHALSWTPGTTAGVKTVPTIDGVLAGSTTYYRHDTAISQNGYPSTNSVTSNSFQTDAAPLWTPADATSATLEMWLDPTTGVTLDGVTGRVEKIVDRTGNWAWIQPTDANQPAMTTENGVAAIDFSGSDNYFLRLADAATESVPQFNIGATDLFAGAGDAFTLMTGLKQVAESNFAFGRTVLAYQILASGPIYPRVYTRGAAHSGNQQFTDGTLGGVSLHRWSGTVFHQTADGKTPHNVQTPGTNAYSETDDGWTLGNSNITPDTGAGKQIQGDLVIFSGALSDAEARKVEGYIAHKYGWQSRLVTGHPYKSTPPTTA